MFTLQHGYFPSCFIFFDDSKVAIQFLGLICKANMFLFENFQVLWICWIMIDWLIDWLIDWSQLYSVSSVLPLLLMIFKSWPSTAWIMILIDTPMTFCAWAVACMDHLSLRYHCRNHFRILHIHSQSRLRSRNGLFSKPFHCPRLESNSGLQHMKPLTYQRARMPDEPMLVVPPV